MKHSAACSSNLYVSAILLFLVTSCSNDSVHRSVEEETLTSIHRLYVNGWKEMNKEKVLSLFREDARIQPSGMPPFQGKKEIASFWFPDDGSVTTINQFDSDILSIDVFDTLATVTYTSYLDWSYKKDSTRISMAQNGFGTMILRKERDNRWKIWRQMWTDVSATKK